jgi:hypothetical protein
MEWVRTDGYLVTFYTGVPMGKKGVRSRRGVGEIYDVPKSETQVVKLTSFSYQKMRRMAKEEGISYSEFVERLIRDCGEDQSEEQLGI